MHAAHEVDSPYAWFRLLVSLVLATIGGCGMYVVVVVLPAVQAEFEVARGVASIPYTITMIGFGIGGIVMGRLTDRFGITVPVTIGGVAIAAGFVLAAASGSVWTFGLAYGLLVGMLGSSATFSPLVTDISFWFERRRGIAVAICASGNYLAGTFWPPIVQHFVETVGWRQAFVGIGLFCLFTIVPLAQLLRRRAAPAVPAPAFAPAASMSAASRLERLGISSRALLALLCVAGVACCVAMSMPQVHIVAYCGDLGYGPARGAQMLSLMLGFGVLSRIGFGLICDRIGGLRTLLLGSVLQGIALLLFLPFDSLASLFVVSALFGLFQGGIVPSYAIIVREFFPASGAGLRVGLVITATLFGMALGGWLSGVLFDLTGSYDAAFVHGIGWNALNVAIVAWLLLRLRRNERLPGVLTSAVRS